MQIRVRHDKDKVYLCVQGRPALEMPWEAARELAKALREKAGEAREYQQHEIIIADQAMLMGLGSRIGLSVDRRIKKEARRSVEDLLGYAGRKPPLAGIPSPEQVGRPIIRTHPPKRRNHDE